MALLYTCVLHKLLYLASFALVGIARAYCRQCAAANTTLSQDQVPARELQAQSAISTQADQNVHLKVACIKFASSHSVNCCKSHSCSALTTSCVPADNGVTSSWDCSKAEEKEGEVRAAKAARGRARQQKAEKHSSRLAQQREKAAQALAAVQTLHRDPASQEPATAHKAPAPAHMGTTTTDTVMTGTATGNSVVSAPDPSDADVRPHDYELRGNDGQQQQLADGQQSTATQTSARPLPSAQSMPIASAQSVPFVSAQSMPVQIQGTGLRSLSQNHGASPNECSDVVTERGSNSLTRGAGAVNSLRSRMVPLPMSPSHSLGSQCYSPNSMQSWQIVRPRPVQDRRSSLKGPSHVHVQA